MEAEHERVTHHKLKLLILECEIEYFDMHGIGRIRYVSVKTIEYRFPSRYADAVSIVSSFIVMPLQKRSAMYK